MEGKNLSTKIKEIIEPVIKILGYELWGCELQNQGRGALLRVYIESPNGVTLDDCAKVSEQISGVLDVEDPIVGRYELEVSSPGLDRLLFTADQYNRSQGQDIHLKLRSAVDSRRNYTGQVVSASDGKLTLLVDGVSFVFPLTDIEKARIVPKF